LDEIGAMPLALQARLLRAIEQRTVRPVGTASEIATNVRIVAASNARLRDLADSGHFRSDLLFRLSAFELDLPALRDRGTDALELAEHFLSGLPNAGAPRALGDSAKQALLGYSWPGNVRELENAIRAAVALSSGKTLQASDLPPRIREAQKARGGDSGRVDLDALERAHIERVLRETGGNRSEAARQLGIDRVTLYRKMKRYRVAGCVSPTHAGSPSRGPTLRRSVPRAARAREPDLLRRCVARLQIRAAARGHVDREPIELSMQGPAIDAQQARRASAVSIDRAQHGLDVLPFDCGPARVVRARLAGVTTACLNGLGQITLAGRRIVVVGDDEVDAALSGFQSRADAGDAAVDGDDDPRAF
jgi:transposase-like protein